MLSQESRSALLSLAKRALESFLNHHPVVFPNVIDLPSELAQLGAVFVTLRDGHSLRGCVGNLEWALPLAHEVMNTAIASASEDPRFGPLTQEELPGLLIEISVLSPLRRVQNADEIKTGEHGVMVVRGHHKGLFLPQVWKETDWDKTRFLNELCESKAGLPAPAWKDPLTELYIFDVESFSAFESDIPNPAVKSA